MKPVYLANFIIQHLDDIRQVGILKLDLWKDDLVEFVSQLLFPLRNRLCVLPCLGRCRTLGRLISLRVGGDGQGETEKQNQFPDVVLRVHIISLSAVIGRGAIS